MENKYGHVVFEGLIADPSILVDAKCNDGMFYEFISLYRFYISLSLVQKGQIIDLDKWNIYFYFYVYHNFADTIWSIN